MKEELKPWRSCPFTVGARYRVRQTFSAMRDSFAEGEVLIYHSATWSRHDEATGYCFRQDGNDTLRVWDIADESDIGVWTDLFQEEITRERSAEQGE